MRKRKQGTEVWTQATKQAYREAKTANISMRGIGQYRGKARDANR